jgi:hypothetical protein
MGFGERAPQGRPTVTTGAERDFLSWVGKVGLKSVVIVLKPSQVNQHFRWGWFPSQWREGA